MKDGLGLEGAYDATLSRIKGQGERKARLGMAALMWISHAERPLKPDELCHALAVEIGSPNFNSDSVPSIGTLLACCQGLVVVDKEALTIRLIHFTLQEFLRAHPELFGTAHSTMAETCLSYLNLQQVKALPPSHPLDLQSAPFLEYSSLYWGIHAKRHLSDCAKLLALKLFDNYNNHISIPILLKAQGPYNYYIGLDKLSLFNGLHCASIFGIDEIITCFVEMKGCDINQKDCVGNTALMWATYRGHEGVVKALLGRDDVDPNKPNKSGLTPLWWAIYHSHEGVVKALLGRDDVDPNKPNKDGTTPLWRAIYDRHEGALKALLGRDDVDPNKPNKNGETPLWCAIYYSHEGAVKALLGRDDIDPNKPDQDSRTPLWWAAHRGHEGVVKILLERGGLTR